MIKIGITGQTGFIGTHLFNTIELYEDKFIRIPFQDELFRNDTQLQNFVKQCDVIVHLAAMNRHNDPEVIYNTNIELVNKMEKNLINLLEKNTNMNTSSTLTESEDMKINEELKKMGYIK